MEVDKIQSDVSEIMLIGITRNTKSPSGEKAIKKKINIKFKGGKQIRAKIQ